MHKFMGLHHHNLISTAPNHSSSSAAAPAAQISRNSSGPLMPHSSSSSNMLTCAVRGGMGPNSLVTVRCLPVGDDDGLLQLSGTNPGDAIMGDVDTEPRPGMGQEQRREGRSQAAGDASIAHALKASIPKGPLAEDAAMCEPMPGDPPRDITDQELAAMREGRSDLIGNISTSGSTPASSSNAAAGDMPPGGEWAKQTAGGVVGGSAGDANATGGGGIEAEHMVGGSNAPADDPNLIKRVVQEETLHGQE
ncbi:hypothetical protein OEZ85_011180 [Tetradesmus obliquus]|uniref:Uncharacterized protein n=1 Tax=Tetradesmus obliquus TaxID=3088 RepID=A0ABY8TRQ5_TETOB|nr:hypothetical protein OEZ85_011180 [Tetradesmus obliquus]